MPATINYVKLIYYNFFVIIFLSLTSKGLNRVIKKYET